MNKQIEAMKLALKALENSYALRDDIIDAKEALREALAEQPEPLPVKTYSGGKAWHVAPEPEQQAAAVMTCGAVVSNVYEAYEAGKKAQPQPSREPLPYDKNDMEGLDANQRLGFKLGWKSAEAAHGITGSKT